MATQERLRSRGAARSRRILAELAAEVRHARLALGLSQEEAGRQAGLSADKVWRIENQQLDRCSIPDACVLSAVLGLDLVVRTYPNGARIRDASQAPRLVKLVAAIAAPLRYQTDSPLTRHGAVPELRAWDVLVSGSGERTGIELETRLTDIQASTRRHNQKRADDPVEHFLLVVADTRHNRAVMQEFHLLLGDLPRLATREVLDCLRAGKHPPTGWMYF